MLAAEHDESELIRDSLRHVEPVQLGVQQPRQTRRPGRTCGYREGRGRLLNEN